LTRLRYFMFRTFFIGLFFVTNGILTFSHSVSASERCSALLRTPLQMQKAYLERLRERQVIIDGYRRLSLGFTAEEVPTHDTVRIYSASGKIPKGAKARVLLLHGMGWNTSTHALWREMLRVLSDPNPEGNTLVEQHAKAIHRSLEDRRILVGAEAIDMPGHGVGAETTDLVDSLDASVDYLGSYVRLMKNETPELPIVVVGWSWSGPIAIELERRYPELVDGLVLLGITEPGEPQDTAARNFEAFADSEFTIEGKSWPRLAMGDEIIIRRNREGITWASSVSAMVGALNSNDFLKTPTLFMAGDGDSSVNEATRLAANRLSDRRLTLNPFRQSNLRSRGPELDWRSHEPFHGMNPENEPQISPWGIEAYQALNNFLDEIAR